MGPWGRMQTTVYFVRSGSSYVLIDTGWAGDGERIAEGARHLFGERRPAAILLTHCHPDHSGSAAWLAQTWGCDVHLHPDELPVAAGDFAAMQAIAGPLDRWVVLPMMQAIGRRRREALLARTSITGVTHALRATTEVPGLPDWKWIPTPGHTPGHVSYFRPRDRVLVSGDALLTLQVNTWSGLLLGRPGLSGPPWYTTWHRQAAEASIRTLAQLGPTVVAGGHGSPMTDGETSARLRAFAGLNPEPPRSAASPIGP
jgi:glyoxylase-like metal-dependent hydrolase (beta-lactamase superfamily II)